jgi:hypothetical protein
MPLSNSSSAGLPPCSNSRVSLGPAVLILVVSIIFPLFILTCDYFLFISAKCLQAKNIKIMVIGDKKDMLPNFSAAQPHKKKAIRAIVRMATNLEPGTGSPKRKI